MKKTLAFFFLWLLSPWLIWSSPWAIVVNLAAGTIQTFDMSVNPPRMYGPFLGSSLAPGTICVAVTPDNHYALVGNYNNSKIYKIDITDPTSPALAGTISLGDFKPEDLSISPNGKFAVATDGHNTNENRIAFINLADSTSALYPLTTSGTQALAVAIAKDNQTVILCDSYADRIIYGKVNAALNGLTSETLLSTDRGPNNVAVSPDGATILVACIWGYCVDVFKISADGVLSQGHNSRISGFYNAPQGIAFSPDSSRAYVFAVGAREALSWLKVNGPDDVSMGGDRVANLFSYGNGVAFYGVDQIAVSPMNDMALAGASSSISDPHGLPTSTSSVSLIILSNFQATILVGSQFDGVGVATFNSCKPMLTIQSGAGGTTNPAPGAYAYDKNSVVSVQANANANYRFLNWTGDASGSSNPISITMDGDKTIKANFIRRYTLTITAGTGGTTNPVPGTYTYDEGASVSIQAQPSAAYKFDSWTGDATGSANPVTVVMTGNKSVQANFLITVFPPLNVTGERLVIRNVSTVESVARLKWQANPVNSGTVTYRVYQVENGQATKLADVVAGTNEYIVRKLVKTKSYLFGVTAVNGAGGDSEMALVTIR